MWEGLTSMRNGGGESRVVRFARNQSAATAVEFAFVAPILIATLIATLQVAVIFIAQSYLAVISDATARFVLTNQAINYPSASFSTKLKTQLCSYATAMFPSCSSNMIVSLQPAPATTAGIAAAMPTFDSNGNLKNPVSAACIAPNTKALLIVAYQWPVISGPLGAYFGTLANGNYLLTATEVFQTEPPTGSQACAS